jgi:hypothetical protein
MTERMNGSWRRATMCSFLVVALFFSGVTIARAQTTTAPCQTYDESCKGLIQNVAIVTAIGVGALVTWKVISGKRAKAKRDAAPGHLQVAYEPTNGTALYHMVMRAVSSNCPGDWSVGSARKVSGILPPGMILHPDHTISGTPDGSGTWQFGVGLTGLRCKGRDGRTQAYADRTVDVTIRIE